MPPFYPGPSGFVLQSNGTPLSDVSALNFVNGSLTLSGTTAEYIVPELTVTDGASTTISNVTLLTANSLELSGTPLPPTVVQKVFASNGGSLNMTATNGNYVVLFLGFYGSTVPSNPFGLSPVSSLENYGGQNFFVFGGEANSTVISLTTPSNSICGAYEISGWAGTPSASNYVNTLYNSLPVTIGPSVGTTAAMILAFYCTASFSLVGTTLNLPSGSIDDNLTSLSGPSYYGLFSRTPSFANGTAELQYTNSNGGSHPFNAGYIIIPGENQPGTASITG